MREDAHTGVITDLVSSRFCNGTQISNIYCPLQGPLVGSIEDCVQGDVLQYFVDSQLVRIENHLRPCLFVFNAVGIRGNSITTVTETSYALCSFQVKVWRIL
jgi:hypothetical protein